MPAERTATLDVTQKFYLAGSLVTGISNDSTSARSILNLINEKAIKDYIDSLTAGGSGTIEEITAGEDLSLGDVVYLADDAKWYTADYLLEETVRTEIRIVKDVTILSGATGEAYIAGVVPAIGLTPGAVYYVGSGGTITDIIPETEGIFQRKLGTALTATALEFLPDQTYIQITLVGDGSSTGMYSKVFGNVLSDTILPIEHGMAAIRGARVLKPTGEEIEVYFEFRPDNSLYVESNTTLLNFTLKMY